MKGYKFGLEIGLVLLTAFVGTSDISEAFQGCQPKNDPNGCANRGAPLVSNRWCKVGETPKKHKCIDGSGSGG